MSTQTNTFRLHKLSRTNEMLRRSSLSSYEPKETFKLAALRSITNGIKHNDLTYITGRDLNKLRVQHNETEDLSYLNTHETFTSIRKRYDELKKERVSKEELLVRLKEQLENVKGVEAQYLKKKTNAHETAQELEKSLEDKRVLYEETAMNKKVLAHIVHRLKQDKVVYDYRKFIAQKELIELRKHLNIINEEGNAIGQATERTRLVYEKLVKQIEAQQKQREQHLNHMRQSIHQLRQLNEVTELRSSQMKEIAERAMQDKDENQKKWKNLLVVHKFLSTMLRDKMERQMNKFRVVETAFKNIKIATGTNDTQNLVNKFLNKQSVYGELLGTIAENEKKIEKLKQEKEFLLKQRKEIEDQQNLFEIAKKGNTDLSKEVKNLEVAADKNRRAELQTEKFYAWLIKQHKKIAKVENKDATAIKYPRDSIVQCTNDLLNWMQKLLEGAETKKPEDFISTFDSYELNKRDIEKLFRIKPKKQSAEQQQEDPADILQSPTVAQQEDIVSNSRNQVLKSNERFMRDLKKKREQALRLKIEMSPKKKEEEKKPNQIKKQQDQ